MLSYTVAWKRSVALSVAVAMLAAAGGLVSSQRHTALAFTPTGAAQAGYSLTASPDRVAPDDTITLAWTAPAGSAPLDYVRFFEVGAPDTARLSVGWKYTDSATSGTFEVIAPVQEGEYEFRYLLNNTFNFAARSNPVTVTRDVVAEGTTLVVSPESVAPGASITLTWTGLTGRPSQDYVRFFEVGAPDDARLGVERFQEVSTLAGDHSD